MLAVGIKHSSSWDRHHIQARSKLAALGCPGAPLPCMVVSCIGADCRSSDSVDLVGSKSS